MSEQPITTGSRRIAEDAQGPRTDFKDIEVGHALGSFEWVPDEDMIAVQCRLDQDFDPWYSIDSPYGGAIAPPQLQYRPPRWLLSRNYNIRGLFYRWELENLRPILAGVALTIAGCISDKYVRKGREFVVYEAEATNPEGEVVFRTRRTHVLDVIVSDAPRVGSGVDSGIKQERV